MKFSTASWLLLLLCQVVAADDDCNVRHWLADLEVGFKDTTIEAGGYDVTLTNVTCKGVEVGKVETELRSRFNLNVDLYGIATKCYALFHYKEIKFPHLEGDGTAEGTINDSTATFGMQVTQAPDRFPIALKLDGCTVNVVIADMHFSGGVAGAILEALRKVLRSTFQNMLDDLACNTLTTVMNSNITDILKNITDMVRPYARPLPPAPSPPTPPGSIDLLNSPVLGLADYVLETVAGTTGVLGLNSIADLLTNGTGTLALTNTSLTASADLGPTNATAVVHAVNASGLDTFAALGLHLSSAYAFDTFLALTHMNLSTIMNITLSRISPVCVPTERIEIRANLSGTSMHSTTDLFIHEASLNALGAEQLLNVGCLCSTITDLNFTKLQLNVTDVELSIRLLDGDVEEDLKKAVQDLLALVSNTLAPTMFGVVNMLLAGPGRAEATRTANAQASSLSNCTAVESTVDKPFDTVAMLVGYGWATLACVVLGLCVVALERRERIAANAMRPQITEKDLAKYGHSNHPILKELTKTKAPTERSWWMDSMLFSRRLPLVVRVGIPFLIFINMASFFSANTATDAGIYIELTAGRGSLLLPSFFNFSLLKSYTIAVCSGAWPYVKLVLVLVAWVLPVTILPETRREFVLQILDILGKWALFEMYVLVLMMVAVHFHVESPAIPQTGAPAGLATVTVLVEARWGLYAFLIAVVLSLVLTHGVLAIHRHVSARSWHRHLDRLDTIRAPLSQQPFRVGHTRAQLTILGQAVVAITLIASIGFVAYGTAIHSFEFHFKGIAAQILTYLNDPIDREYSSVTLGTAISPSQADPRSFGVVCLTLLYFLVTLIMPFVLLCSLLVLWMAPLSAWLQRRVYVVIEVIHAWSSLEVFVVAILSGLHSLETYSNKVMGEQCASLDAIFEKYFGQSIPDGSSGCLTVSATLDSGHYTLLGACVVYIITGYCVMRLYHKVLEERSEMAVRDMKISGAPAVAGGGNNSSSLNVLYANRHDSYMGPWLRRWYTKLGLAEFDESGGMARLEYDKHHLARLLDERGRF